MLYLVLNEQQVMGFNFYLGGKVQQGMQYRSTYYGLAYTSEYHDLPLACELAQQLGESGCNVVLTIGKSHKVWVALNPAEYPYYQTLSHTDPLLAASA